jgi:hypothetical protein
MMFMGEAVVKLFGVVVSEAPPAPVEGPLVAAPPLKPVVPPPLPTITYPGAE